ncbi:MAG: YtxH domain-containing protein [Chloroflexi bacterium]|nr:YtxH domain-containing protein [Chloroflexota bacterium]
MAQKRESRSYNRGFVMGLLISAPLAVWFAPRSGEETRQSLLRPWTLLQGQAGRLQQQAGRLGKLRGESVEDAIAEGKAIAAQRQAEQSSQGT